MTVIRELMSKAPIHDIPTTPCVETDSTGGEDTLHREEGGALTEVEPSRGARQDEEGLLNMNNDIVGQRPTLGHETVVGQRPPSN